MPNSVYGRSLNDTAIERGHGSEIITWKFHKPGAVDPPLNSEQQRKFHIIDGIWAEHCSKGTCQLKRYNWSRKSQDSGCEWSEVTHEKGIRSRPGKWLWKARAETSGASKRTPCRTFICNLTWVCSTETPFASASCAAKSVSDYSKRQWTTSAAIWQGVCKCTDTGGKPKDQCTAGTRNSIPSRPPLTS